MIRLIAAFLSLTLAGIFSTASAETYSWTDEKGTVHFTEDLGSVPEKIRIRARILAGTETSVKEESASEEPTARTPAAAPTAAPADGNGDSGIYAGKTRDEWQKDLADRETEMMVVKKRLAEIAGMLSGFADNWDEQKKLRLEHMSLSAQFKEMKSEYFQQVEIARKAGLQVNIEQ